MKTIAKITQTEATQRFIDWVEQETNRELYTVSHIKDKYDKCNAVSMSVHFPKMKPSSDFVQHSNMMAKLGQVVSEPLSKQAASALVMELIKTFYSDELVEPMIGMDLCFSLLCSTPDHLQVQYKPLDHERSRQELQEEIARFEAEQRQEKADIAHLKAVKEAKENGGEIPSPKAVRRRVDWDDLDELHEKHGGNTAAIAELKGCSDAAVQRMYRIKGWDIDRKSTDGRRGRKAVYDWSNLESLKDKHDSNTEEIAKVIGCSPVAVERRFRMNGWEINKPKPEGQVSRRGGKRGYSEAEEKIIRQGIREQKTDEEIVTLLADTGYTRTAHAIMYCRTRKFSDEKQFAGKVKLFKDV